MRPFRKTRLNKKRLTATIVFFSCLRLYLHSVETFFFIFVYLFNISLKFLSDPILKIIDLSNPITGINVGNVSNLFLLVRFLQNANMS